MRLENSSQDEEQRSHPHRGYKERQLSTKRLNAEENKQCCRNKFHDTCGAVSCQGFYMLVGTRRKFHLPATSCVGQ